MAAQGVGPSGVSSISPTARDPYVKLGRIDVADAGNAFAAFGLPKGAVVVGVYTLCTGANATQTVNVGFTAGGTDLLNAFAPNSTGYAASGAATGTAVGTKLSAEQTVFLRASATLTTPVIVKVEYVIAPPGLDF